MMTGRKGKKANGAAGPSFEEAVARLEAIVRDLEATDVPLEKALGLFEEGVRLSAVCGRKLDEAEKKILALRKKNAAGDLEEVPFGEDEEDDGGEDDGGETSLPF
jgi:exodeoxyribonuclease VII small subunit